MSSDGEEVSAMAYGLQLTGCGIFLVEQLSGISAVLKPNSHTKRSPYISVEASFCMVRHQESNQALSVCGGAFFCAMEILYISLTTL